MRVQGFQNGVEDELGFVERLAVYNVDPDLAPSNVLPRDGIVVIKEPYYKRAADGRTSLRVDHPSDLMLVDADHPLVPKKFQPYRASAKATPSAAAPKANGNRAYQLQDSRKAHELYTKALEVCPNDDEKLKRDLYRNRSLMNLHLQR